MSRTGRAVSLLLCALLLISLCVPAAATAGSAGDPLISRSYITSTYIPEVRSALKAAADTLIGERLDGNTGFGIEVRTMLPGESVMLSAGQQFTLLSGSGMISIEQGSVVNVTVGYEATDGVANPYSRYIVCEDSKADLDITSAAVVKVSAAARTGTGSPFADVRRTNWFYADVVNAVRRGLVNGMTPTIYQPNGTLTVAQCVKLAACMHQLDSEGAVTLENTVGPWYTVYRNYALEHGILDAEPEDYDAVINRAEFVGMFYRALPESGYTAINAIPDGAVPDIPEISETAHAEEIYTFYRAGILMGYTADGNHAAYAFGPEDNITRAEVATIMNRMFEPSARRSFTIE